MSETSHTVGSPVELTARLCRNGWNTLHTVYYANTPSWRVLKSGALLFFGFFLWAGANVLLSYEPSWWVLHYPMAYGFVLVFYGPFHHLVVIPLALRWRRRGDGTRTRVGRHLPNAGLAAFLVAVVVLGTAPGLVGPMAFDFDATLDGTGVDVDPELLCTKGTHETGTDIHCHLTEADGSDHDVLSDTPECPASRDTDGDGQADRFTDFADSLNIPIGIDAVTVESGGERIAVDEDPPFDFTVRASELEEVVGQKQFQVVLRDANGDVIRRYTRTVAAVDEAD